MAKFLLQAKFTGADISLEHDNLEEAKARADEIARDGFILKAGDKARINRFIKELYYPKNILLMTSMSEIGTGR